MAPPADPPHLGPGDRVAGFQVEHLCGLGGFGTVYRAVDEQGEPVALKVLHRELLGDARTVARFRLEADAVARVDHPGVVRVREVGTTDDGRVYIAMDWLEGHTLRAQLRRGGRLSLDETRAVVAPLCDALSAAHAAGVVHRDVKSSNIMLTPVAGELRVTLLDFGIAKLFEVQTGAPMSFTSSVAAVGSPHAMAPEQFRGGPVDARTDVYGIGVLIYEMLTGRVPFSAANPADLRAMHIENPPPKVSHRVAIPVAVDAVVERCMAKDPAHRYGTVAEVAAALADAATSPMTSGPEEVEAIATYVSAQPLDDSDAALDAADTVLDRATDELTGLGLAIVSELPSAVLGVIAAPALPEKDAALERSLADLALELTRSDDVEVAVVIHRGVAAREHDPTGDRWTGPLLELGSWASAPVAGVTATRTALARVSDEYEREDDRVLGRRSGQKPS